MPDIARAVTFALMAIFFLVLVWVCYIGYVKSTYKKAVSTHHYMELVWPVVMLPFPIVSTAVYLVLFFL